MSASTNSSGRGGASRRDFLKTSIAAPLAIAAGGLLGRNASAASEEEEEPTNTPVVGAPLPRRKLGRNGPEVTTISLGGMMAALSPQYLDIAWAMGIRYFDTADCYRKGQSERDVATWIAKYPERRGELFLVTKDHPRQGPGQLVEMLDRRLERLRTDYVDMLFIHGLGTREYGEESLDWPKGGEFKEVAAEIKASGKAKMVGFSCHDARRIDYLNAAAEGGFVDAIMVKYNTFYEEGDDFDRALDACHDAGIGLVAMKEMRMAKDAPKRIPEFDKLGLTTHQAIIQSVLSDPRIAAICSMVQNVGQMEENTAAARDYREPIKAAQRQLLRDTLVANGRMTMCPGCPSCSAADAALGGALLDVSRFVTYYEQDGLLEARDYYHRLDPATRTMPEADLAAARDACHFRVDYPAIARRAERYFA